MQFLARALQHSPYAAAVQVASLLFKFDDNARSATSLSRRTRGDLFGTIHQLEDSIDWKVAGPIFAEPHVILFNQLISLPATQDLQKWPVSKCVNSSRAPDDDARLIEPVENARAGSAA